MARVSSSSMPSSSSAAAAVAVASVVSAAALEVVDDSLLDGELFDPPEDEPQMSAPSRSSLLFDILGGV